MRYIYSIHLSNLSRLLKFYPIITLYNIIIENQKIEEEFFHPISSIRKKICPIVQIFLDSKRIIINNNQFRNLLFL